MNMYESSGRSVEEAVSKGLEHMGLSIGEVDVDILDEGSKGLFGLFGSKLARVKLTAKDSGEAEEGNLFAGSLDSYTYGRGEDSRKPAPQPPQKAAPKPVPQPPQKAAPKPATPPAPREQKEPVEPKPVKARAPRMPREQRDEDMPARREPAAPPTPAQQRDPATMEGKAQGFLQQLTKLMGLDISVHVHTDEEGNVRVNMEGDPLGILIGRRGETLDALQYLTSLHLNRGQENYTRVTLDSEGYRAKREDALVRLANRMAIRAQKTGRKVSMEPMNPYERRILHSALQNHAGISTHSEGEDPNRHVVITLSREDKDTTTEE